MNKKKHKKKERKEGEEEKKGNEEEYLVALKNCLPDEMFHEMFAQQNFGPLATRDNFTCVGGSKLLLFRNSRQMSSVGFKEIRIDRVIHILQLEAQGMSIVIGGT